MGIRKVTGGKKIDRWTWSLDGRDVFADVYMAKIRTPSAAHDGGTPIDITEKDLQEHFGGYPVGSTTFHALCEEVDVHLISRDIGGLEKAVKKLITERITVEWRTMLLIEVKGDRPFVRTRRTRKDYDPTNELFCGNKQKTSVSLEINVEMVQLAEILGKKYRREFVPNDGYIRRPTRVHEGWPETGAMTTPDDSGYYDYGTHRGGEARTTAMVPDTTENRAALIAIRSVLENATLALDTLLHPDRVADTLARALVTAPTVLALPVNTQEKRK